MAEIMAFPASTLLMLVPQWCQKWDSTTKWQGAERCFNTLAGGWQKKEVKPAKEKAANCYTTQTHFRQFYASNFVATEKRVLWGPPVPAGLCPCA